MKPGKLFWKPLLAEGSCALASSLSGTIDPVAASAGSAKPARSAYGQISKTQKEPVEGRSLRADEPSLFLHEDEPTCGQGKEANGWQQSAGAGGQTEGSAFGQDDVDAQDGVTWVRVMDVADERRVFRGAGGEAASFDLGEG